MEALLVNSVGRAVRTILRGREYLVAPATIIVPGVLPGSQGSLLYPPEEVTGNRFHPPSVWNHIPIVVYHPYRNGVAVSAREPDILNSQSVGMVLRSHAAPDSRLKCELWFDVEDTRRVDNRVLEMLEAGEPIELSTGLQVDKEPAPAGSTYNGRLYDYVARNYRPDHLAILPDQTGACSLTDGCGVFNCACQEMPSLRWQAVTRPSAQALANATKAAGGKRLPASAFAYVPDPKTPSTWKLRIDDAAHVSGAAAALGKGFRGNKVSVPRSALKKIKAKVRAAWKKFYPDKPEDDMPESIRNAAEPRRRVEEEGLDWQVVNTTPDLSYEDMEERVRCAFREAYPSRYDEATGRQLESYYVLAVFPTYVIYIKEEPYTGSMYGDVTERPQLFRQSYTVDASGTVSVAGGPVQVERVVQYVPV